MAYIINALFLITAISCKYNIAKTTSRLHSQQNPRHQSHPVYLPGEAGLHSNWQKPGTTGGEVYRAGRFPSGVASGQPLQSHRFQSANREFSHSPQAHLQSQRINRQDHSPIRAKSRREISPSQQPTAVFTRSHGNRERTMKYSNRVTSTNNTEATLIHNIHQDLQQSKVPQARFTSRSPIGHQVYSPNSRLIRPRYMPQISPYNAPQGRPQNLEAIRFQYKEKNLPPSSPQNWISKINQSSITHSAYQRPLNKPYFPDPPYPLFPGGKIMKFRPFLLPPPSFEDKVFETAGIRKGTLFKTLGNIRDTINIRIQQNKPEVRDKQDGIGLIRGLNKFYENGGKRFADIIGLVWDVHQIWNNLF